MEPQSKYTFHHDPGHGWIEIPRAELSFLGICDKISVCSYVRGDRVFLEEDADRFVWISAWDSRGFDVRSRVVNVHSNSTPIRGYASYRPAASQDHATAPSAA